MPRLKDFIKTHPHLRVTISCQATNQTLQMLENRELDLGLTGRPEETGTLLFSPVMEIQDTFVTTGIISTIWPGSWGSPVPENLTAEDSVSFIKNGVLMLLNRENLTRQYLDAHMKEPYSFPGKCAGDYLHGSAH